ncbi:uncharacterized protein VTP21DRAFT_7188 [Calcarisporiella thermophila]|uniref:uncharacterized protein n=1 Tax=Calcarisporiella thermophila TaxID=911321 RepID=UPI0037432B00
MTLADSPVGRALTIAGSDCSGGAGIQADLKTFTALKTYGLSVLTAVTSQNTQGVDGIVDIAPSFVAQQLRAVVKDIGVDAAKTGMLFSADIVRVVAQVLKEENVINLVVDPVMVSTSGSILLNEDALEVLISDLLPITLVVTPNIHEAQLLCAGHAKDMDSVRIKSLDDMKAAAKRISALGPKYVLLKGGHLPLEGDGVKVVYDVLYDGSEFFEIPNVFVSTKNTHGTGCTLSAAIAAELAKGKKVKDAVEKASAFLQDALRESLSLGHGHGPLNHFHNIRHLPYRRERFFEALKLSIIQDWHAYTHHPFVEGMANGTLPRENFIHYLRQDYRFLESFARAYALAAYKSQDMESIAASSEITIFIAKESRMHLEYCESWGIPREEVIHTPESMATIAYTRFVLDQGMTGDLMTLRVALASCVVGYGEIGTRLFNDPRTKRDGNPYWKWIETYAADDYQQSVRNALELLEKDAPKYVGSPERFAELVKVFRQATRLEISFWEMGLNCL